MGRVVRFSAPGAAEVVDADHPRVAPHPRHRWDELRMSTTVVTLARDGALRLADLVSHVVSAEEAPAAYRLLGTAPGEAMQVVLDYGTAA